MVTCRECRYYQVETNGDGVCKLKFPPFVTKTSIFGSNKQYVLGSDSCGFGKLPDYFPEDYQPR